MEEQLAVQNILRNKLISLQLKNPRTSIRAFSQRLGLSASAANEILKGQRRVSRKMAERLAMRLSLNPTERNELLKKFVPRQFAKDKKDQSVENTTLALSADQFSVISSWQHFAILSLVKTKNFKNNPSWVAERLGISTKQATDAIDCLVRIGLIVKKDGRLKRSFLNFNTSDDILNVAIQKAHMEDMERAQYSLLNDPIHLRDFSSITMPTNIGLIAKAKEIIRNAQDEISSLLESKPGTEVYRLCVQLYPLTKVKITEQTNEN
jgi:uncharacterized protein (TIGR02147 family)